METRQGSSCPVSSWTLPLLLLLASSLSPASSFCTSSARSALGFACAVRRSPATLLHARSDSSDSLQQKLEAARAMAGYHDGTWEGRVAAVLDAQPAAVAGEDPHTPCFLP